MQKILFYKILWLFKTVMSLLITSECLELSILYWNARWNIALKQFSDENPSQELSDEDPSKVPWFRYNWLQQALVESIQQFGFCLYEKLWLHSFITQIYFQVVFYSCQIQICYTRKSVYYLKIPCASHRAATLVWFVLVFEKQTQLPCIVLPKRDMMHLWLHKLKGTLSIWGIAVNVRCCY